MKKLFILCLVTVFILQSCSKDELKKVNSGDADFKRIVIVGASITAGFSSFALYRESQMNSYGAILASQLKKYNLMEGDFKIPYMPDDIGVGIDNAGNLCPRYHLVDTLDCNGNSILDAKPVRPNFNIPLDASLLLSYFTPAKGGPFNLLAIPGAKSYHFISKQYGSYQSIIDIATGAGSIEDGNPFLSRMLSDPGNLTCIDEAMKIDPTFFIIGGDIGGNDVLGYATNGGGDANVDITPLDKFDNTLTKIIQQMTGGGAQGVIGTVPDVTSIAFFRKYHYDDLIIDNEERASLLRLKYPGMNFKVGKNPLVFIDSYGTIRQVEPNELICIDMPYEKVLCGIWGAETPLPQEYVLDKYEIQHIKVATDHYNSTIRRLAGQYNLAVCDWNGTFNSVSNGYYIDGRKYSSDYITGGIFSLDGVHATYIGYAWIANLTIAAINEKYHSNIPMVNLNDYKGLEYPNGKK